MDREAQLRDHIHHLLYDYAKTHLTTDYDVFTRIVVPAVSIIHVCARFRLLMVHFLASIGRAGANPRR